MIQDRLRQPVRIPDKVAIIEGPPDAAPGGAGGVSSGDVAGLVIGVLMPSARVASRPPEPKITRR